MSQEQVESGLALRQEVLHFRLFDRENALRKATQEDSLNMPSLFRRSALFVILLPDESVTEFDGDVLITSTNAWLHGTERGDLFDRELRLGGGADAALHAAQPKLAELTRRALVTKRDRVKKRLQREHAAVTRGEQDQEVYQEMLTPRGSGYFVRAGSSSRNLHERGPAGTRTGNDVTPRSHLSDRSDIVFPSPRLRSPRDSFYFSQGGTARNEDDIDHARRLLESGPRSARSFGTGQTAGYTDVVGRQNTIDPHVLSRQVSKDSHYSVASHMSKESATISQSLDAAGGSSMRSNGKSPVRRRSTLDLPPGGNFRAGGVMRKSSKEVYNMQAVSGKSMHRHSSSASATTLGVSSPNEASPRSQEDAAAPASPRLTEGVARAMEGSHMASSGNEVFGLVASDVGQSLQRSVSEQSGAPQRDDREGRGAGSSPVRETSPRETKHVVTAKGEPVSPRGATKQRAVKHRGMAKRQGSKDVLRLELGEVVETLGRQRILHTCLPCFPSAAQRAQLSPATSGLGDATQTQAGSDEEALGMAARMAKRSALEDQGAIVSCDIAENLLREVYHDTLFVSMCGDPLLSLEDSPATGLLESTHRNPAHLRVCYPALGCGARNYPAAVSARACVRGWLDMLSALAQDPISAPHLPHMATLEVRFYQNYKVYREWAHVLSEMLSLVSEADYAALVKDAAREESRAREGVVPVGTIVTRPTGHKTAPEVDQAPQAPKPKKLCCFR